MTAALIVEPGSKFQDIALLRNHSDGAFPYRLGSKSGNEAIARISPVRTSCTMAHAPFAP